MKCATLQKKKKCSFYAMFKFLVTRDARYFSTKQMRGRGGGVKNVRRKKKKKVKKNLNIHHPGLLHGVLFGTQPCPVCQSCV